METANSTLWLHYVTFLSATKVVKINKIKEIKRKNKLINHIIRSFLNSINN